MSSAHTGEAAPATGEAGVVGRPRPAISGRHRRHGRLRRSVPPWLFALILVPILLGWIAAATSHDDVERELSQRIDAALIQDGLAGVGIDVQGRDVRLVVPADIDADRARQDVQQVSGIASVSVEGGR